VSKARTRLWTVIFVSGIDISSIGDFIYLVAINVFVLDKTHTASAVAGLWVVSRIAALIVGPWAGSVADRLSRRKQLIVIEFCRAGLIGVLPLLNDLFEIYAILFLLGACSTFFSNVFLPYQTMLIPEKSRKRVNSIISTLRYSAFLTGPAIAGLLLIHGNTAVPLWLDSASFLVSAISFVLLPNLETAIKSTKPIKPSKKNNPWRIVVADWRQAFGFLGQNRLFTVLFCLNAVIGIFALTADTQEVVFARQALHLGQLGYGMMVTAAGIGFVSGSLTLSVMARRIKVIWLIGVGSLMNACGYLIYSLSHTFWWAVFGLIMLGIFGASASLGFTTYTQQVMPVSNMGRINSVIGPPQQLLNIVSILLGGVVATWLGVRVLMVSMTVMMFSAALVISLILFLPHNRAKVTDLVSDM